MPVSAAAVFRPNGRSVRIAVAVAVVIIVLAGANVLIRFGPGGTGLVVGPVVALLLVTLARRAGLSWEDLGLARRWLRRGAGYAIVAVFVVAAVYLLGVALPGIRSVFLDARYQLDLGSALVRALLVIPLGTILLEEIAFRSVLFGLLRRHRGWAFGLSSGLFGLWHILPSLPVRAADAATGTVAAHAAERFLAVAAIVGITALLGLLLCELRRRSGSLLAAVAGHWAANGLAVVLAAVLWTSH